MDAEQVYQRLILLVEELGLEVSDEADELLADAARQLTNDPCRPVQ